MSYAEPSLMESWMSSYVKGNDNVSGWGERYFFTYFTQMGGRHPVVIALEIVVLLAIFVVSILTNLSIIVCVIRYTDMRTVTNFFILNLAIADLLFALTSPAVAYSRLNESWKLSSVACKGVPYVQFVSGTVLLWTLACISIDRYKCIVIPPYRSKMTTSQAALLSAGIWLIVSLMFIPLLFWFGEQLAEFTGRRVTICTLIFPRTDAFEFSTCFIVLVIAFACLLPMIILVYSYHTIFCKILSTRKAWAVSCVESVEETSKNHGRNRRQSELSVSDIFTPWPRKLSLSQQEEIRVSKHIKVVRILFANVIVVLFMWLPITVVMVLIFVDGSRPSKDKRYFMRSQHFVVTLIVALLNTVVNPILYGALSDNFRSCLSKMFSCKDHDQETSIIIKDNVTPSSGRNQGITLKNGGTRRQSLANSGNESHAIA